MFKVPCLAGLSAIDRQQSGSVTSNEPGTSDGKQPPELPCL